MTDTRKAMEEWESARRAICDHAWRAHDRAREAHDSACEAQMIADDAEKYAKQEMDKAAEAWQLWQDEWVQKQKAAAAAKRARK